MATALIAVNSLIPVCEARSGLLNAKDLPVPRGRHLALNGMCNERD
jgi:hypothetical protein